MNISHQRLQDLVTAVFQKAGCSEQEAQQIAYHLVLANLSGHDSHGVIRVPYYIEYLRNGMVEPNQTIDVVSETDVLAVVDGRRGFGQAIGEQCMQLALRMLRKSGVAVVAVRNCGHLGRIGHWPEIVAGAGQVSLHFVNTSGYGILVAPFGGIDRRLSANPIAAGIPRNGHPPIILDISTCAIAEGKLKVARNCGLPIPEGCVIDAEGHPTNDPEAFYRDPPGAILPFGGHKGYGLSVIAELLAGALTGSGCSRPGATELFNGMLTIALDPAAIPRSFSFVQEIEDLISWVKSARTISPDGEILLPGEMECRMRSQRLIEGVPLDDATIAQLHHTCQLLGLPCDVGQQKLE